MSLRAEGAKLIPNRAFGAVFFDIMLSAPCSSRAGMAARAGAKAEVDNTTIAETGNSPLSVGSTIVINDKNKGGVANNNKKSSADE